MSIIHPLNYRPLYFCLLPCCLWPVAIACITYITHILISIHNKFTQSYYLIHSLFFKPTAHTDFLFLRQGALPRPTNTPSAGTRRLHCVPEHPTGSFFWKLRTSIAIHSCQRCPPLLARKRGVLNPPARALPIDGTSQAHIFAPGIKQFWSNTSVSDDTFLLLPLGLLRYLHAHIFALSTHV